MITILLMSAKTATLGLLKIKVFWSKGYDVIISTNDLTNKILSRDSYYIVDAVMRPKFGESSISMREVIMTSILWRFGQKKHFLGGVVLVQVQLFGAGTRYGLAILYQCEKRVKTKKHKVFWANSYVCRSYRGKTGRGTFLIPHPE